MFKVPCRRLKRREEYGLTVANCQIESDMFIRLSPVKPQFPKYTDTAWSNSSAWEIEGTGN